ncbi:MAG: nicotinate-nucleotide adenylyltransferase [bacterium]
MSDPLGLFGGMFNPIHHGHRVAVQETAHQLSIDSVLFLPTSNPPHKDAPDIDPKHRIKMTELALEDKEAFSVSTIEFETKEPSYTYRTLEKLKSKYPERELVFMTGSDELVQFTEWYHWDELLDEFTIVGMSRPGFEAEEISERVRKRCRLVEIPDIQISSSLIRTRLSNGAPAQYFLPDAVWNYIDNHGLYQPTP